jgi:hypothetical protein
LIVSGHIIDWIPLNCYSQEYLINIAHQIHAVVVAISVFLLVILWLVVILVPKKSLLIIFSIDALEFIHLLAWLIKEGESYEAKVTNAWNYINNLLLTLATPVIPYSIK